MMTAEAYLLTPWGHRSFMGHLRWLYGFTYPHFYAYYSKLMFEISGKSFSFKLIIWIGVNSDLGYTIWYLLVPSDMSKEVSPKHQFSFDISYTRYISEHAMLSMVYIFTKKIRHWTTRVAFGGIFWKCIL